MDYLHSVKDRLFHKDTLVHFISTAFFKLSVVIIIYLLGTTAIRLLTFIVLRALESTKASTHIRTIAQKAIYYAGLACIALNIANVLGLDLSVLLGAAGVAGVAIGFASQTSMSNLISGIFLLSENFIKVGDDIECGSIEGKVESIDLFSVKIRTADGKLVRAPNELLIKQQLTDITYYPARQIQISVAVPPDQPIEKIVAIIETVLRNNTYITQTPRPIIDVQSLSPHAQHVLVSPWAPHNVLGTAYNTLIAQLYAALHAGGFTPLYVSRNK